MKFSNYHYKDGQGLRHAGFPTIAAGDDDEGDDAPAVLREHDRLNRATSGDPSVPQNQHPPAKQPKYSKKS